MIENERRKTLRDHLQQVRDHLNAMLDLLVLELDDLEAPSQRRQVRKYAVSAAASMLGPADREALDDRHCWILTQLGQGVKLTRAQVMHEFNYSVRHAKRLLGALTARGLIRYEAKPRPGYYALCGKAGSTRHV
jgi:hypothetical protein